MKIRKPDFDHSEIESLEHNHYLRGNALGTHMLNSFHIIVPIGERFFIRTVKLFAEQASAPLRAQLKKFYGQENIHDQKHVEFWDALKKQGYNIDVFLNFYNTTAFVWLEPLSRKIFGPKFSLSLTVALEHYTALMATSVLDPKSRLFEGVPKSMKDLMLWHAAEEIEHKAVAFDLLKEVGGGYFIRTAGFLVATFELGFYMFTGMLLFLIQDRKMTIRKFFRDLFHIPFTAWHLAKTVFFGFFRYLKPGFHPNQDDNEVLAAKYLEGYS